MCFLSMPLYFHGLGAADLKFELYSLLNDLGNISICLCSRLRTKELRPIIIQEPAWEQK